MACLIAFLFLPYLPYVRAIGEEAWAARADVEYARQFADRVPTDGMVLTQNPSMFLALGHQRCTVVARDLAHAITSGSC